MADVSRDQRRASLRFQGARTAVVNALRRIIMAEVPYIATYRLESRPASSKGGFVVAENTGRLHNDMLVDRIALVPIHLTRAEVEQYIPGSIVVRLRVKNDGALRRNVTSRDLSVELFGKPHPNASACYPPSPVSGEWPLITRLYPGERIDVTATLEKGTASTHAAFAVASVAAIEFSLDEDAYAAARKKILNDAELDESARSQALNFCDHITRKRLVRSADTGEPAEHTLTVVSECGLTAPEIASAAMDVLLRKFSSSALAYEARVDERTGSVLFTISGQGHTFGSVLQDVSMRDREQLGIRSVGYFETHPLEDRIVVRVDLPEGRSVEDCDHDALIASMRTQCVLELEAFRDGNGSL